MGARQVLGTVAGVLKAVVGFSALVGGLVLLVLERHPVGWVGLAFFGGGALVLLVGAVIGGQEPPASYVGSLPGASRFTASDGTVYPASRSGLVATAFGALVFVITGVLCLATLTSGGIAVVLVPAGVLCLAVFGPMLAATLATLARPAGVLVAPEGAYLRLPLASAWIPWGSLNKPRPATGSMGGLRLTLRKNGDGQLLGGARAFRRFQRRFRADLQVNGMVLPQAEALIEILDETRLARRETS
jgi:hypothetical protein